MSGRSDNSAVVGWEQVVVEAEERLEIERLRSTISVHFDKDNCDHHALLCQLFAAAFPDKECMLDVGNCVADEWISLGFQTPNPATDFRGAGVMGLRVLLHIVHQEPQLVSEAQERLDLFAACTLSLVQALAVHLKLYGDLDRKHVDPSRSNNTLVPRRKTRGLIRKGFNVRVGGASSKQHKVNTARTGSPSTDIPGVHTPVPTISTCRESKAVSKRRAQLSKPANVLAMLQGFGNLVSISEDATVALARLTVVMWVNVLLNLGDTRHDSIIELMRFSSALQRARENVMLALLDDPGSFEALASVAHSLSPYPEQDPVIAKQSSRTKTLISLSKSARSAGRSRRWFKRASTSPTRRPSSAVDELDGGAPAIVS